MGNACPPKRSQKIVAPKACTLYPDSFWKGIISRLGKESGKACSEILPRSSDFNGTNPSLYTTESLMKPCLNSIYTRNLINHTNVTAVGNIQHLEGGRAGAKYDEGH